MKALMNSQPGQPFSLVTLSGDRDTVLQYYLSNGFDQVKVEIKQTKATKDADRTDVSLNVTEGQQVFVNRILLSGVVHTRPKVVENQVLVHPGDPLDQTALLQTQRNLYNIALFNEVVAAVQNPAGDAPQKNVLLQLTEAKRWNVTYGFGIEAQTGTPQSGMISEASCIQLMLNPCNQLTQEGKTGVSPRVSLDVSRINLRGTDNSLTLHSSYGLLEQVAILTFQNPHFYGYKSLAASVSGGYSNIRDITTFASSTLQGDFRITQRWGRRDTFIYDFLYRRVAVESEQPAGFGGSDSIVVTAGPCGRPGSDVVSRYAVAGTFECGEGSVHSVADVFGFVEVWFGDEFLEDRWDELDLLPVRQTEVCDCAGYTNCV